LFLPDPPYRIVEMERSAAPYDEQGAAIPALADDLKGIRRRTVSKDGAGPMRSRAALQQSLTRCYKVSWLEHRQVEPFRNEVISHDGRIYAERLQHLQ
jgi:hypothetical protein